MNTEWLSSVIAARSAEDVVALVDLCPDPLGLSLVEGLSSEVVRYGRIDKDAMMHLAVATHQAATRLGDPRALAMGERALGNAEQIWGNYSSAVDYYYRAAGRFELLGDELELARTYSSIVGSLIYLSEFEKGLQLAERARVIFERHHDEIRLARLEVNRGNLFHRLDRFQEAIECYDRAHSILEKTDDYEGIAGIKSNLATCLIVLNRHEEALKTYQEVRTFCQEHNMPLLVAQADYNIAYLYYQRGQYSRALEMLSAAAERAKELDDLQHLGLCDLDQSEIYLELNLSRDAIELSERAAEVFRQLGMRYELAKAITNAATAHAQLKNMFKALEMFDQSREMFEAEGNRVWVAIVDLYKATIYFTTGRHFEAIDLCRRALSVFETQQLMTKSIYAQILMTKILLGLNKPYEAKENADSAKVKLEKVSTPWLNYQCNFTLGLAQEALGETEAAAESFSAAITALETIRGNIIADELKITFFKDKLSVYERLIALCLDAPGGERIREAYDYVERSKSRALVDLLSSGVGQVRRAKAASGEVVDHIQQLREELNWFYSKVNIEETQRQTGSDEKITEMRDLIRQREIRLTKILRQLPLKDEEYAALHSVVLVPTERIQRSLSPSQTLIEYYIVQDQIHAFLLTQEGLKIVLGIGDVAKAKNELDLLKYQLSKFNFGSDYVKAHRGHLQKSIDTHLSDLYDSLFRPLEAHLDGHELVIVPHGFLHYVPFHALKRGDVYTVDQFTISYAPSASVFRLCSSRPASAKKQTLVMGIPDARIPFVEEEAQQVSMILPNASLLLGEEATEEKLKSMGAEASILHIASHAVFRNDNPMFSSIQMGTSWLNLFDIYNIELDSDLVVLSGCGTGMSRIIDGDEIVGLARGFFYAGTRSLVVSLWNAYDRSTAELMQSFYTHLHDDQRDIAGSLRLAMQELREKYPHPYYWAPFFLMGKTTL
jgi:CHAT domain-containing protein